MPPRPQPVAVEEDMALKEYGGKTWLWILAFLFDPIRSPEDWIWHREREKACKCRTCSVEDTDGIHRPKKGQALS